MKNAEVKAHTKVEVGAGKPLRTKCSFYSGKVSGSNTESCMFIDQALQSLAVQEVDIERIKTGNLQGGALKATANTQNLGKSE